MNYSDRIITCLWERLWRRNRYNHRNHQRNNQRNIHPNIQHNKVVIINSYFLCHVSIFTAYSQFIRSVLR